MNPGGAFMRLETEQEMQKPGGELILGEGAAA